VFIDNTTIFHHHRDIEEYAYVLDMKAQRNGQSLLKDMKEELMRANERLSALYKEMNDMTRGMELEIASEMNNSATETGRWLIAKIDVSVIYG